MKVIGLTGGIGSGKTTVANFFKDLGVPVYIADNAGKELMVSSSEVRKEVIALLGEKAYNGKIPDRKFIASEVFSSAEKLENLNKIIHPAVEKDFKKWRQSQNAPYVIYEAAILFETGKYKNCDAVILVTSPLKKRISRLQIRDHSTREEIETRMQHQWGDEKKKMLADFEVKNSVLSITQEQVQNLHEILLNTSRI